jgi:hypothetical protein
MTAYHSWLIRQRRWCERCSDLNKATTVVNVNGRDEVMCQNHAGRLDAARKSDRKQSEEQWNKTVDQLLPQGDPFDYLD